MLEKILACRKQFWKFQTCSGEKQIRCKENIEKQMKQTWDKYQFTFGKGASFKVRRARLLFDYDWASVLGGAAMDCYAFSAFFILDEEGWPCRVIWAGITTSSWLPYFMTSFTRPIMLSVFRGVTTTSCIPRGFVPNLILIIEHCSTLGWNGNLSSLPLILKRISPAPTLICAPAVLRNGLPRISGVSLEMSMSSTTKSTGMN